MTVNVFFKGIGEIFRYLFLHRQVVANAVQNNRLILDVKGMNTVMASL